MSYKDMIADYKFVILDFDLDPYENLDGLHVRTELHEVYDNLTMEEKALLLSADLEVLNKAKEVHEQIAKAYDFNNSTESKDQWWWYLHKIAKGELLVHFNVQTQTENKDIAL